MVDQIQSTGAAFGSQYLSQAQPLTSDQKNTVDSILKQYDATSLTAADAKNIFQSLNQAGIQPSKSLMDEIKADGFDPQKMRQLAGGRRHHGHHGSDSSTGSASGASQVNLSSLQNLQSILSQYDLSNLSADQSQQLQSQLSQSGLTQPGSTINLLA